MARAVGPHGSTGEYPEFIPPKQAARILHVHPNTLCKWRISGGGPAFVKVGRRIRYRTAEISAWADENTFLNTAQYGRPKPKGDAKGG